MNDFAIVIVTYFPTLNDILNLSEISDYCGLLVIVDNTDVEPSLVPKPKQNIAIIKNNHNLGLAAALNKGIEFAGNNGFNDIFIFDQDTRVDSCYFDNMLNFKLKLANQPLAFCVPNFFDRNCLTHARFPILSRFVFEHLSCPKIDHFKNGRLLMSITSGTLISYDIYKFIGSFKDEYFIDFIDNEYCLRAYSKNLFVAVNCNAIIDHSIGIRSTKSFLDFKIKPNNHPPVRRYYIARNGVRTSLDYRHLSYSYIILLILRLTHEVLSIVLFEGEKIQKLKAILFGIIDGFMKKMGKLQKKF